MFFAYDNCDVKVKMPLHILEVKKKISIEVERRGVGKSHNTNILINENYKVEMTPACVHTVRLFFIIFLITAILIIFTCGLDVFWLRLC